MDHKYICVLFKELSILFIVISQPSFDHKLTGAIYLSTSVWVN